MVSAGVVVADDFADGSPVVLLVPVRVVAGYPNFPAAACSGNRDGVDDYIVAVEVDFLVVRHPEARSLLGVVPGAVVVFLAFRLAFGWLSVDSDGG